MRRILALALCLTIAGSAFAAQPGDALTCFANQVIDGQWSNTAHWSGCGGTVPDSNDDAIVPFNMLIDVATASCRSLDNQGNITVKDGDRTIKIGNNVDASGDGAFFNSGSFYMGPGHTLEFNTTNATSVANRGYLSNTGLFSATGRTVRDNGVVSRVAYPDDALFLKASANFNAQFIKVTDDTLNQPSVDFYVGKVFWPTSGAFKWQAFDIVASGTAPCTSMTIHDICLDATSRGAFDTRNRVLDRDTEAWTWKVGDRGKVFSNGNATVASGTTTVTLASSQVGAGETAYGVYMGSKFICQATDLSSANDTDFRTICSVTDATHIVLCTAYGTGSCAAGAAMRIYDYQQPAVASGSCGPALAAAADGTCQDYGKQPEEGFLAGDGYLISHVAKITATTKSDTTMQNGYILEIGDGSTTTLRNVDIGYCGNGDSDSSYACLSVRGIDGSSSTEGFNFDLVDIFHAGGQAMDILDSSNLTLSRFGIHDTGEGVIESVSLGGLKFQDTSGTANRTTNVIVQDFRLARLAGSLIDFSTSTETDTTVCSSCKIRRGVLAYAPNNGAAARGINASYEVQDYEIDNNFFTNIDGDMAEFDYAGADFDGATKVINGSHRGRFWENVVQNSQTGLGYAVTPAGNVAHYSAANLKAYAVGNVFRSMGDDNYCTWNVYNYSNHCESDQVLTAGSSPSTGPEAGYRQIHQAAGNTLYAASEPFSSSGVTGGITWEWDAAPCNLAQMPLTGSVIQDNAVLQNSARGTGSPLVGDTLIYVASCDPTIVPSNLSIKHNTLVSSRLSLVGTPKIGAYELYPATHQHTTTWRDNIFVNMDQGIREANNYGGTDSDYNLFLGVDSGKECFVQPAGSNNCGSGAGKGSHTVVSGRFGFRDWQAMDFTLTADSTAKTMTSSDGQIVGVRIAGAPYRALRAVYPFLAPLPFINNIGGADSDGDGIYDLHDNCDFTFNPRQDDGDVDGKGDVCDATP